MHALVMTYLSCYGALEIVCLLLLLLLLSADSLADNEYLRRTSADRVFQWRSVRGKNEYLQTSVRAEMGMKLV